MPYLLLNQLLKLANELELELDKLELELTHELELEPGQSPTHGLDS